MAQETLTYGNDVKGWTSFHDFLPDWFTRCNNRFFTIKDGNLQLHNDEDNPIRNSLYGVQVNSEITTILNPDNSEDKIFKTIALESTHAWQANIKTNFSESNIKKSEFNQRESRWFSYIRKSENKNDLHGGVAQGIGVILSNNINNITFAEVSPMVCIGDSLFQLNGNAEENIGIITNVTGNIITVSSILTPVINGLFSFSIKNARVEGSEIRGYYAELKLVNNETTYSELFAIESNIIKSYV